MQALTACAFAGSGVTREESVALDKVKPTLFERLGQDTIEGISALFYDRVFDDEEWFRSIFSASTKREAVQNQADFLVERLGGPKLYTKRKGKHYRLIHRHSPYDLNPKSAARWLEHMEAAIDASDGVDAESKRLLIAYFSHMAFFLVAGKDMSNPSNLVDYHNKMAESCPKI
ncbi:unnamed protein product [Ectocarpus sp. 12 AP-2014]